MRTKMIRADRVTADDVLVPGESGAKHAHPIHEVGIGSRVELVYKVGEKFTRETFERRDRVRVAAEPEKYR